MTTAAIMIAMAVTGNVPTAIAYGAVNIMLSAWMGLSL